MFLCKCTEKWHPDRWILASEQPKHGVLCSAEGLIHTNIYTSSKTRVSIHNSERQLSSQLMAAGMALQLCRLSCCEAQLRFRGAAMDTLRWLLSRRIILLVCRMSIESEPVTQGLWPHVAQNVLQLQPKLLKGNLT